MGREGKVKKFEALDGESFLEDVVLTDWNYWREGWNGGVEGW